LNLCFNFFKDGVFSERLSALKVFNSLSDFVPQPFTPHQQSQTINDSGFLGRILSLRNKASYEIIRFDGQIHIHNSSPSPLEQATIEDSTWFCRGQDSFGISSSLKSWKNQHNLWL